jgi:putative flavoprotein involved in K+ transport
MPSAQGLPCARTLKSAPSLNTAQVTVSRCHVGASGGDLTVQANANQVLDEADKAYADFVSAARQFISKGTEEDLADEEPEESIHLTAVEEVDSLDLTKAGISTIIWATGYDYDFGWVRIPTFDERGRPIQQHGVTPVPGLYFLGLHWMHTFKSGLLSGVGADAEFLADHMARTPAR